MKIGIGDFPLGLDERDALQRVIDSGRISEHREVRAFEEEFADWLGVKHCVALSSGTAALMAGLTALKYDERFGVIRTVMLPGLTFIATVNAVELCGFEPVFGDIDPITFCLRPDYVDFACDMVIPVHLFGYVADMTQIVRRAQRRKMVVVEDSCEAHGSLHRGQKAGTFGLWSAFSFYVAHTVQAGELGILATNDSEIAGMVRSIKAHGRECRCKICTRPTGQCPNMKDHDPRYHHIVPGFNFKPMEFPAALARVQLKKVEANIERRHHNVVRLSRGLRHLQDTVVLPHLDDDVAYMVYPIVLKKERVRHQVIQELEKERIECRPLFGCVPLQQPAYSHLAYKYKHKLPIAEHYGANGLFVGCHQYLTDAHIDRMVRTMSKVIGGI